MAEKPDQQSTPPQPPEGLHWGISYLREDIQDIRQETRQEFQEVRQELQDVRQEMRQGFQEVRQEMREEFQNVRGEIGHVRVELQGVRQTVESRFYLLLGTTVTMTGVILAAVKL